MQPEVQQAVKVIEQAVSWPSRLALGTMALVLAPAGEELLFRGILYPRIKQAGFPRLALWGTAILFAAVHTNTVLFLPLLVLALALTALYEWSDNLLAPIAGPQRVQCPESRPAAPLEVGWGLMHIGQMNEFELIKRLTRSLPSNKSVVVGAGDDCAVLDAGPGDRLLLFKTDAVVEGVHFASGTPPEKVGHKALGRCLSDIAAMAGTPTAALVTLGLPRNFEVGYVEGLYGGMNALARRHEVAIVGGETTTNPERMLRIRGVARLGGPGQGRLALGGQAGDAIFVTGELGGSLAGKHLEFEPRLVEARWLAEQFPIHAMLDLSDGLAGDLRHILQASRVGAELLSASIPISAEARRAAKARPIRQTALAGGTDGRRGF